MQSNTSTHNTTAESVDPTPRVPSGGITPYGRLILMASVIGIVTGVAAWVFKWLLATVSGWFIPRIAEGHINWWLVGVPVAGILITGIFTRYVIHTDLTHGVAQLMQDLRVRDYKLKRNLMWSNIVGGTMTLGMGGSSGAEGPIAYTGAAIGSNLGQWWHQRGTRLKVMVACGAGAGISAIFSAPLGGFLFAVEVLRIGLTTLPVLAVITSCLTAYLTIFTMNGFAPDLAYTPAASFDISMWPVCLALGVFCGLYCIYYSHVVNYMDGVYKRMRNPWVRNVSGGVVLGVILLLFPSMFGVGYGVTGGVINGAFADLGRGSVLTACFEGKWVLLAAAAGILACKCWAVSSTNSSGGVGGDFAPTLFSGAMCGFLFASLWNIIFGTELPVALFAYFGMAAVMSGAIQAPLMAIFIVLEMCDIYALALPVATAAAVSYFIVIGSQWTALRSHPVIRHLMWFEHRHKVRNAQAETETDDAAV